MANKCLAATRDILIFLSYLMWPWLVISLIWNAVLPLRALVYGEMMSPFHFPLELWISTVKSYNDIHFLPPLFFLYMMTVWWFFFLVSLYQKVKSNGPDITFHHFLDEHIFTFMPMWTIVTVSITIAFDFSLPVSHFILSSLGIKQTPLSFHNRQVDMHILWIMFIQLMAICLAMGWLRKAFVWRNALISRLDLQKEIKTGQSGLFN